MEGSSSKIGINNFSSSKQPFINTFYNIKSFSASSGKELLQKPWKKFNVIYNIFKMDRPHKILLEYIEV